LPGPGNGREWIKPLSTPLAPPPTWISTSPPAPSVERETPHARAARATEDARVLAIARRVERAIEGERNSVTFWAACRLAEIAREGLVSETWATSLLILAATRSGLPENEARRTIASGFRR